MCGLTPETAAASAHPPLVVPAGFKMKGNNGYCSESFDGFQHSSDDDDDALVDIAGVTLDFSSTDDVPPLNSGK